METKPLNSNLKRSLRGFTLVEMLIAMGITGVLITAVAATLLFMGRSMTAMMNYTDLDHRSRNALDTMMNEIRQCVSLQDYAADRVLLVTTNTGTTLEFFYDSDAKTLNRVFNGETNVLLTECEKLAFEIFRRNPTSNGDFTQFEAATTPGDCKVIQVNWLCSRKVLGNRMNTESVQTAKIVMRNKL